MKYALQYYLDGIDELLYMDTVATLYGRNNLLEFVKEIGKITQNWKNHITIITD